MMFLGMAAGKRDRAFLCCCVLLLATISARAEPDCPGLLKEYQALNRQQPAAADAGRKLLYALQTPGTKSIDHFTCVTRPSFAGSERCPSVGATLDASQLSTIMKQSKCSLMTTLNDSSILNSLPADTQITAFFMDPVERLISAYELTVEVAASKLSQPAGGNQFERFRRSHVSDYWPWTELSDMLVKDARKRAEELDEEDPLLGSWARVEMDGTTVYVHTDTDEVKEELTEAEKANLLPDLDPYNNPLVMPFEAFVKHPRVLKLLHNGQAMQVLGLTNMSSWDKAQSFRKCIRSSEQIADDMLSLAKDRVARYAFIGDGSDLPESAERAAAALGRPLDGPAYDQGEYYVAGVRKQKIMSFSGGMKGPDPNAAGTEVEVKSDMAAGLSLEELKKMVAEKEAELEEMTKATGKIMKGEKDAAKVAAARNAVTALRGTVMMLKTDLEGLEGNDKGLDKELGVTVGVNFHNCTALKHEAATTQTEKSLKALVMPDGRTFKFSSDARKNIPQQVLDNIRSLNALDVKLYEDAKGLISKQQQELQAAGKLQKLPALKVASADKADKGKTVEL